MIYAIQAKVSGAVKFGIAKDPNKRLRHLQVGNHEPLSILGADETTWDEQTEKDVHEWLQAYHLTGEWFKPGWRTNEVVRAIQKGEISSYIAFRSFSLWLWNRYRDERAEKWLIKNDDHFALLRAYQLITQLSKAT